MGADKRKGKAKKAAEQAASATGSMLDHSSHLDLPLADRKVPTKGISRREYERQLARLHIELVKLQHWIVHEKLKVVILCEGRDAAGKGGTIKRITECLNP
ncbi:MAG: polyphosphate kinase 2, partial [Planctomycetes bacterium]|nr:polyphosphate kinase 2 [Planctomycetota bacterium]